MSKRTLGGVLRCLPCLVAWILLGHARVLAQDGNAVERPERAITLAALLSLAEEHAPRVRVASARREYGEASLVGASIGLRSNPNIELGVGPRISAQTGEVDYDLFASLAQPLEISGARGRRIDAATRQSELLESEATLVRWQVRREVTRTYRLAQLVLERIRIARELVDFATRFLNVAERRQQAGDISLIDVRVAESDLAAARQNVSLATRDLHVLQIRLAELAGTNPGEALLPSEALGEVHDAPTLTDLLGVTMDQHPRVATDRANVLEARARTEVADRDAWLQPVLGASFAREGSAGSPPNFIVLGTMSFALPLWQRNQGERARTRVDESVAEAELDATRAELIATAGRAHAELVAAIERVRLFANATSSLSNSIELLRRGFEAGELSFFQVAVARERFLSMVTSALEARADYERALLDLEGAIGHELGAEGAR